MPSPDPSPSDADRERARELYSQAVASDLPGSTARDVRRSHDAIAEALAAAREDGRREGEQERARLVIVGPVRALRMAAAAGVLMRGRVRW